LGKRKESKGRKKRMLCGQIGNCGEKKVRKKGEGEAASLETNESLPKMWPNAEGRLACQVGKREKHSSWHHGVWRWLVSRTGYVRPHTNGRKRRGLLGP